MNVRQRFRIAAVLAGAMVFSGPAVAGTVIIPSFDRGWVTDEGRHTATNTNYATSARELSDFMDSFTAWTNSFFVFDLSVLSDEAATATFRVYNPPTGFVSPDTFETLELNPIDKLPLHVFFADDPGTGAFADLGDGTTPYASQDIQNTDVDVFIDIPLNAAALFDLNQVINFSPIGYFGFGGKLTTVGVSIPGDQESVFADSGSSTGSPSDGDSVLILSGPKIPGVPEPATWLLLMLGVAPLLTSSRSGR